MSEYLLEIGSGELPYEEVRKIPQALKKIVENFLADELFLDEKPHVETYATPRRTVLFIKELPAKSSDREIEIIGPPINISYQGGVPAEPLLQFMKKTGISDHKKIYTVNQKKGVYVACKKKIKGALLKDLLTQNIPLLIKKIPFKKTMFWLDKEIRYPRPVLWITSVFDGKTAAFDFGGIKASNRTYVKPTLSYKTRPVKIYNAQNYFNIISANEIILKNTERKDYIESALKDISKMAGADVLEYGEDFIDEIVGLTETPYALLCGFDKKFLSIPQELLSVVMKKHQRFFPLSKNGKLISNFIAIADVNPVDEMKEPLEKNIKSGYSRVLSARLADAEFFFNEDIKKKPADFVEETRNIMFYQGLGTYFDKTSRIKNLGLFIGEELNIVGEVLSDFKTASGLLKFDLATHAVYEFPEMQGVMGRIYAEAAGENLRVSNAIEEHYYPASKTGGDKKKIIPSNDLSALCALSDKLDTVFAFVMLKKLPSGESDPFYLRRAMIGIIEIILDKKYKINLIKAFDFYFNEFFKDRKLNKGELKSAFINFADTRFKNFMLTSGYKSDEIAAVLNSSVRENFYTEFIKIDFLSKYKENEAVFELSQIYKRINNITFKFSDILVFNEEKLTLHEEKQLISVFKKVSKDIVLPLKQNDFKTVLTEMHKLVMPVNVFFDGVMILAEQEEIKNSRIGLLNNILNLLKIFCDFSSLDL